MTVENERRSLPRFTLLLPVWLQPASDREPNALTRDIGANGVFFYTSSTLTEGAKIQFVTRLPMKGGSFPEMDVRYTGNVVRVEVRVAGLLGVAVQIDSHEIML
jgi:predicted lipoprotein